MEKRLFLAIILSTIILILYNLIVFIDTGQIPGEQKTTIEDIPIKKKEAIEIPPEDLLLETDLTRIELSQEGEIKGWWLKQFKEGGKMVNMVHPQSPFHPLGVFIQDERITPDGFKAYGKKRKVFIYNHNGLIIKKVFTIGGAPYIIDLDLIIENPTNEDKELKGLSLEWRGGAPLLSDPGRFEDIEQTYFDGERLNRVHYKGEGLFARILGLRRGKGLEEVRSEGMPLWISQKGRYFLTLIIPLSCEGNAIFRKRRDGLLEMGMLIEGISLPPFGSRTLSYKVYSGPKDYDGLAKVYPGVERLAGFNFLSLLTLKTLKFFNGFCHNYGLAIILLALVVKVLLYPLSHATLKSMRTLQRLQPEINRIRARYKEDREKLNQEMILLYRRHKINPLGGCFPFLLQLPILYAIFTALRTAIELKGAPFILWIKDLSEHDPWYILPLLMGVTMFLQQRLSTKDPQQIKMMGIMTALFTFFFMGFPSGLVLYWLFQNILSIGQELLFNRLR